MDPRFRSRLIVAIILLTVVCSAFSVSSAVGFHLENRDGSGAGATLAEALVLQQSTRIRSEYMENLTVYIDSRNEAFSRHGEPKTAIGLYVPEESAIYIRSDRHPEQADDAFAEQIGYRVYHTMGFEESTVFSSLAAKPGSRLEVVSTPAGEKRDATIFAGAFMLYHTSPGLLEEETPEIYAYMDLLAENGGDAATVDDLYTHGQSE
ncbi:MAG: hypothetical protein GX882_02100 [Methanomicrobiales archaeon]|nr:hypothetical protein [Methanomicrobiales archaeon]